ncbi:MAG TPA: hypothetical protein VJS16_04125 [Gammaproteobacteria bacterium]|nr:hypothetical protein [Gammaproteobacteria bacterium]
MRTATLNEIAFAPGFSHAATSKSLTEYFVHKNVADALICAALRNPLAIQAVPLCKTLAQIRPLASFKANLDTACL